MPVVRAGPARIIAPVQPSADKPGGERHTVSIHDVAAAAGVSIATVSRVVNGTGVVAAATAARVREAVQRLGYTPNPLAQVLGSGESHVLGIALPKFHGEFMSRLLSGADEEAARLGYHLIMTTITSRSDRHAGRGIVGSSLIDALLVVLTETDDPLASTVLSAGLPTVVIDTDLSAKGLDSVVLDNERGTRDALDHLLRWVEPDKLYFVGGPRTNFDAARRAGAFEEILLARGHKPRPDQVSFGDYSADWGKEWATRMHQKGMLAGAVLAGNDKIACGIMRAAEDARVWVPDQLRVVGFNDSQLSQLVRPRLSTVSLPMDEMGALAVRTLVRRLENRDAPAICQRLTTKLVVRESSTAMNF
ncbi:MAG: LacI family DNA-binding transcriptional regulator [Tepidisphaera sp.]|nr:LacI family DNA-binding transcriptional regulator [Tepidisphaera sp.]